MKALVTGGTGFIGSHLVEYLIQNGNEVKVFDIAGKQKYFDLDYSAWDVIQGDITNYSDLLKAIDECEVIFHLAGVLGTDFLIQHSRIAVEANIIGTLNVLDAAKVTGSTVVYLSLLPNWDNPYMITKNASAKFCQMYFQEFGVKTIVFRGAHVYGERQKWDPIHKAVPSFIVSALQNLPINIYGSGNQLMDLIYVKDSVEAMVNATIAPEAIGKTFELGSGLGIRVIELAQIIKDLCQSSSDFRFMGERPGEPDTPTAFTPANILQLKNILNFETKTNLKSGLMKTIKWYEHKLNNG